MSQYPVPAVGMSGVWVFDYQISPKINNSLIYTAHGVESILSMTKKNINPYLQTYIPLGLTESDYRRDLGDVVFIVSLKGEDGKWYTVPTSYIKRFPDVAGLIYTSNKLDIDLGKFPVQDDFSELTSEIRDFIIARTGSHPDIKYIKGEEFFVVSYDEADALTRQINYYKTEYFTPATRIGELERVLTAQQTLYSDLLKCIEASCLNPTPTPGECFPCIIKETGEIIYVDRSCDEVVRGNPIVTEDPIVDIENPTGPINDANSYITDKPC